MNELEMPQNQPPCQKGERGHKVKLIQEWLGLHGFGVKIDGAYGPATEASVKRFQERKNLEVTGAVDGLTFENLVAPMKAALRRIDPTKKSLGQLICAYARQHLAQHPMEIGGANCGPWVRLYMDGHEGAPWAWCAGFACFCLKQACETLPAPMPFQATFSCDELAAAARTQGLLLAAPNRAQRELIRPGSFFLVRDGPRDWVHTGIVSESGNDEFHTIEGNSNKSGTREGYEVLARVRSYTQVDFVLL